MVRGMDTSTTNHNSLLRLLHLVSPTLPTGAFSYSQGLEWVVEKGWVYDGPSLQGWLTDQSEQSLPYVDIAILRRMYQAIAGEQQQELKRWRSLLLACRETSELQMEEQTRGRALATLLQNLEVPYAQQYEQVIRRSQLAGFALAAVAWKIPLVDAALGYTWAWLENQVLAGVKIIPLGQTEGQRLLMQFGANIASVVDRGLKVKDHEIGASTPALALACSLHETQYTRLYRS